MNNIFLAIYVLTTSLGLVVLKLGSKAGFPIQYAEGRFIFNLNMLTIGGILLYGLSFALYIYLISKYDLGFIIPITTALVYVLIFAASFFIFKEVFTLYKVTGIALILAGIIFLNIKK